MNRPTRASYSAISTHESCAASYFYIYIQNKGVSTAGPAAARGTRLHKSGEMFIKGELSLDKLPVDYWRVKDMMVKYKKLKAKSEVVVCVNRDWEIVSVDHPDTFIKSVIDLHWMEKGDIHVRDLKTGKVYPDHVDQLQLYGTKGLIMYPKAKKAVVGGVYIDQGKIDHEAVYPRSMLPALKELWAEKANRVLTDTEFKPNPYPANCDWCPFNHKKGGPCAAGV